MGAWRYTGRHGGRRRGAGKAHPESSRAPPEPRQPHLRRLAPPRGRSPRPRRSGHPRGGQSRSSLAAPPSCGARRGGDRHSLREASYRCRSCSASRRRPGPGGLESHPRSCPRGPDRQAPWPARSDRLRSSQRFHPQRSSGSRSRRFRRASRRKRHRLREANRRRPQRPPRRSPCRAFPATALPRRPLRPGLSIRQRRVRAWRAESARQQREAGRAGRALRSRPATDNTRTPCRAACRLDQQAGRAILLVPAADSWPRRPVRRQRRCMPRGRARRPAWSFPGQSWETSSSILPQGAPHDRDALGPDTPHGRAPEADRLQQRPVFRRGPGRTDGAWPIDPSHP